MNRRKFLINSSELTAGMLLSPPLFPFYGLGEITGKQNASVYSHRLPETDGHYLGSCGYVEEIPVPEYTWAPEQAYENFLDIKFGIRVHWGLYSILQLQRESWPFLEMTLNQRQMYQELFKSWNPAGFNADEWMEIFAGSGAKMFSFTSKHHDGFSMYDTRTRINNRANWLAKGGPGMEPCDLAYSIMETPFKRDVVKELTDAAHKNKMKIDLYFSHPDWYDADFRPYNFHPFQVPDAATLAVRGKEKRPELKNPEKRFGHSGLVVMPNANPQEIERMMKRHRAQLEELITRYGTIDMVCLDMFLGPAVWPQLRETMLYLRKIRPEVMYRARGIGNYGDYYTPEGYVPGTKENTDVPWFVIYPLGGTFSYEPNSVNYKGTQWIIKNLIDSVAKGGNFMAGIGPDGYGKFHPEAVKQLRQTGDWIRVNAEGIYATRAREGALWKEGDQIRFTRSKDHKTIYAFSFEWPEAQFILHSVEPRKNARIFLMGIEQPLQWTYERSRGLVISLPKTLKARLSQTGQFAYGFKIEVS